MYQQLLLIQQHHLGFNKENVLVINNGNKLGSYKNAFENDLKQYEDFIEISSSNSLPPAIMSNTVFRPEGKNEDHLLFNYFTDQDHLQTLNLEMKAGRFFSDKFPSDSTAIILNETAMRLIGWEDHQEKKLISFMQDEEGDELNVIRRGQGF